MKKFEYKILDVAFSPELLNALSGAIFGSPLQQEQRKQINDVVNETINTFGKSGWKLHESGLSTLPTIIIYRETGR